jgi:putative cell wall-binding protein
MRRSRSFRLVRPCLLAATLLASLVLATPAHAASPAWSPKLGYVLTTGSVRAKLADRLHLSTQDDSRLRAVGWELYRAQAAIQSRSDAVVMNDALSLADKRAAIAVSGYNGSLESAEESASARAAAVLGMSVAQLGDVVESVWQEDAAGHRLETALTEMHATAASAAGVGAFHVYATRFWDVPFGVAVPDRYALYANQGKTRSSGYPNGRYAVSLYWDGVHHGRDNNESSTWARPRSVASTGVADIGPWNVDDNWWNSYTDPARHRRINDTGILSHSTSGGGGGPDFLARQKHLAFGLPESQAAYFNYYGRPARIPAHTTAWENYWDKPRGYGGQWSGADQFGRQVTQPAAIDLTNPVYQALGMSDNEWIDVVPLWEARLDLVGGVTVTDPSGKRATGPYLTGQRLTFTYTVKNLGSLPGTWDYFTMTLKSTNGSYRNPPYQGPVTLSPGATRRFSFTYTLDAPGSYGCFPQAQRAGVWSHVGTATVSIPTVGVRRVDRVGGATRYDTAVAISKQAYPSGAPAVVVATGLDFPDALAGASLAHAENGPLLLVSSVVPAPVAAELRRLKPAKVFILGGPRAVPAGVASAVASAAPGAVVTRLGGHNRYATARLVAENVTLRTGGGLPKGTVIVATGRDFPDALSASVLSAEKRWPILLTEPGFVPTDTAAAIKSIGATNTLIVGGVTAVTPAVAAALPKPSRIGGSDRYQTAAAVADLTEANGLRYAYSALAVGTSFPDALAGGVLAAHNGGMLLLTAPGELSTPMRYRLQRHRTVTTHLQALGSTDALPDGVMHQAEDALR